MAGGNAATGSHTSFPNLVLDGFDERPEMANHDGTAPYYVFGSLPPEGERQGTAATDAGLNSDNHNVMSGAMLKIEPSREGSVDQTDRALIDQLIAATRLYNSSNAVQELFDFIVRLREFAPFNAMLLHIQKPGLTHAATARDWWSRFGCAPKLDARPLLVPRAMGPVDFVFDVLDVEGGNVPPGAFSFPAFGNLSEGRFREFMRWVAMDRIVVEELDAGDAMAGRIRLLSRSSAPKGKNTYKLAYNRNHTPPTRFVTVAHKLAHLYLGHLGPDRGRRVPDRSHTDHALQEVEAESASYLVARRNGIEPRSESYLADYQGAFERLDLYAITRAANAVETAMGISAQRLWKVRG